jgi:hypothetical protein
MSNVYKINKGVMKSIEFKGIRAQYLGYLAVGAVALLLLYAVAYITGVPTYICLGTVAAAGYWLFTWVSKTSHKYGEHGLMKEGAYRKVPSALICRTRRVFTKPTKASKYDNSDDDLLSGDSRTHPASEASQKRP